MKQLSPNMYEQIFLKLRKKSHIKTRHSEKFLALAEQQIINLFFYKAGQFYYCFVFK